MMLDIERSLVSYQVITKNTFTNIHNITKTKIGQTKSYMDR